MRLSDWSSDVCSSDLAQETTGAATANQGEAPNEIVVTGIRASLEAALDAKRNANAIVDSVSAEDVGKFPNTNVAEALTLVPGVTVDRQFGQGDRKSTRLNSSH